MFDRSTAYQEEVASVEVDLLGEMQDVIGTSLGISHSEIQRDLIKLWL